MSPENECSSTSVVSRVPKSLWQTIPADILALVIEILSSYPNELFAPLVCSHICSHWRRSILGTPSLWLQIDTTRGPNLTMLWLSNSNQSLLDVRLCDKPLRKKYIKRILPYTPTHMFYSPQQVDPIPENIKSHLARWGSLDISLSCTCRVSKVLEFLGQLPGTLHLDDLTIGPMGEANLALDSCRGRRVDPPYPIRYVADPTALRSIFQNANVQPAALRVDTYPVCFNPAIFSARLTVLEVFLGNYLTHDPNIAEWQKILLSTPNLVKLSLWDSGHILCGTAQPPQDQEHLQLSSLRSIRLSGRFTLLSDLLAGSPLPSLRYLFLDSLDPTTAIPRDLLHIASVSPKLHHVSIGSISYVTSEANTRLWSEAFRSLPLLQELTFVETEWREVAVALDQLAELPHNLSRLRLEHIWDMEHYSWIRLQAPGSAMPLVELIDCMKGRPGRWGYDFGDMTLPESEDGSTYSDNSSFAYTQSFPSSDDPDSDESELSYGSSEHSSSSEDDGDEVEGNNMESCIWGI
ncbi:hypothetical protein BDV93DRAFT_548414 [Ceratobasidium sp. AG-I]|nr:hypothetical protein BDV93DRAFT_548414 [Ceratobasidium sp. AG-I]